MPPMIPAVWASRCRTLIGPNGVARGSQGRWSWTGASRSTRPASCSRSSATAVMALPIEATGMSAPAASGRPEATSPTPTANSCRHPPGPISPTASPGAPRRSRANPSSRPAATASDPDPPTRTLPPSRRQHHTRRDRAGTFPWAAGARRVSACSSSAWSW